MHSVDPCELKDFSAEQGSQQHIMWFPLMSVVLTAIHPANLELPVIPLKWLQSQVLVAVYAPVHATVTGGVVAVPVIDTYFHYSTRNINIKKSTWR